MFMVASMDLDKYLLQINIYILSKIRASENMCMCEHKIPKINAESWVSQNDQEKRLPNLPYSPAQMFWISWANVWCEKWTDAGLREKVQDGPHSPGKFRVQV